MTREYCDECEKEVEPRDVRRRLKVSGRISHQLRCPNCDSFLGAGRKTFYNGEEFITKKVGHAPASEKTEESD